MKKYFILIVSNLLVVNIAFAQCNPITIPQLNPTNGRGGAFCLQGSPTPSIPDICVNNINGNFVITKKNLNLLPHLAETSKLSLSDSRLSIVGLNPVNSIFDLSFDFASAGSAIIRSQRGGNHDTKLQFMTNFYSGGNSMGAFAPLARMTIDGDGKIGIGTENPNYILDVFGDAKFTNENNLDGKLVIKGANNVPVMRFQPFSNIFSVNAKRDLSFEFAGAGSATIRSFRGGYMDTYLQFLTNSKLISTGDLNTATDNPQVRMQINEDGKIIIGNITIPAATTTPYKLYVEGGVLTEKVKVAVKTSSNWSDFVFDKNYELKPLYEVEKYINENNHLPNIPSSEELEKDGLDIGEMQAKQMEKIEEITLYLIEMKKEIDSLKKENIHLRKEVLTLKK